MRIAGFRMMRAEINAVNVGALFPESLPEKVVRFVDKGQ
jgi:hypothetical protein